MISYVRGKIIDISDKFVILDVNGLGYKVFATSDTLHGLKIGHECSLHTHLAVREDALDLYGFVNKKDMGLFELLISISGIGPKTALNILSLTSSDALVSAIRSGSTSQLVKVSGIGRKTAEKIALELKDKLGGIHSTDSKTDSQFTSDSDAIEALRALGYDTDDARDALKKINKDITDTGAKIKAALKILS